MATYYYGHECLFEWAVEDPAAYASTPASGAFNGLSFVTGITVNVNENIRRIATASRATGLWPQTEFKGVHQATATINFMLPDDMDSSVNETWILKAPLDEFNVAHDGTDWTVPNTGTSVYGSYALQSYTFEVGFNKSGDIRGWRLQGAYVNRCTMTINKGEKIMWSYDVVCQSAEHITAFTNGSATVLTSTSPPLNWSCVTLQWKGEDDTLATKTDFTNVTINWENNLEPNYDITNMTVDRIPSEFILGYNGGRKITGSITVNRITAAGHKWEEILLSATASATDPSNTIQLGQLSLQMNSILSSGDYFKYTFYNVTIGELPQNIDFTKVQELTLPIEAQYYLWDFKTDDTSAPTNWDDAS